MEQRLVRKVVVHMLERISRYCSVNSDFQVSVKMNVGLRLFYFPFIEGRMPNISMNLSINQSIESINQSIESINQSRQFCQIVGS